METGQIGVNINKLIVTVCLPKSGKATWALQQRLPIISPVAVQLSASLIEDFNLAMSTQSSTHRNKYVLFIINCLFLSGNREVILDECNITEPLRSRWKNSEWKTEYQYFYTRKAECVRRAMEGGDKEAVPIIHSMHSRTDVDKIKYAL